MKPNKESLQINLNRLEQDCQEQPLLMQSWGEALADAQKHVKDCKNALKLIEARLTVDIRRNPGKYGLDKATEAVVEAMVIIQTEYQTAQREQVQAEYDRDLISSMVDALHHRKAELGDLVQLHGQMYWSKPNTAVPDDARKATQSQAGMKVRTMRDRT